MHKRLRGGFFLRQQIRGGWPRSQGCKLTTNEWVPPGPSHSGTGDSTKPCKPGITPEIRRWRKNPDPPPVLYLLKNLSDPHRLFSRGLAHFRRAFIQNEDRCQYGGRSVGYVSSSNPSDGPPRPYHPERYPPPLPPVNRNGALFRYLSHLGAANSAMTREARLAPRKSGFHSSTESQFL
jgi:hypothetical protein